MTTRLYLRHCYSKDTGQTCEYFQRSSGKAVFCRKYHTNAMDCPIPCPHQPTKTWTVRVKHHGIYTAECEGDTEQSVLQEFTQLMISRGFDPENLEIVSIERNADESEVVAHD